MIQWKLIIEQIVTKVYVLSIIYTEAVRRTYRARVEK